MGSGALVGGGYRKLGAIEELHDGTVGMVSVGGLGGRTNAESYLVSFMSPANISLTAF